MNDLLDEINFHLLVMILRNQLEEKMERENREYRQPPMRVYRPPPKVYTPVSEPHQKPVPT